MKSSAFYQRVYQITATIPNGKVATYGQIAALAGNPRASRIVGAVMAHTPTALHLPCHRVVYGDGSLCKGDIFGTTGLQKALLEEEGVLFSGEGKVDLRVSLWNPSTKELQIIDKI